MFPDLNLADTWIGSAWVRFLSAIPAKMVVLEDWCHCEGSCTRTLLFVETSDEKCHRHPALQVERIYFLTTTAPFERWQAPFYGGAGF